MVIEKNSGVSGDHDLMDAVEEYFELSLRTRKLCASIRVFVKKSRDAHQIILDRAIAMKEAKIYLSGQDCKEILEELKVFKGGLICVEEFESVCKSVADMQSQLGIGKGKVDRRNTSYKKSMKSRSIAAALVKRLKMLVVKKVLRNVCERNIRLKSKFVLVETMKFGTFKSYRDVVTMRVLMDRLHAEFVSERCGVILLLYSCLSKILSTHSLNSLSNWKILTGKHVFAVGVSPRLELLL